jgi:tRNA(Ile)-lysidine synthase
MLSEFEKKVARFVERHELLGSARKVALAASGGADSTALLYAMQALKAEKIFNAELLCAHINHQLRGEEADLDEAFVLAQAAELNLAAATRRVDVCGFACKNKLSIETAARQLRIGALTEIARENHCDLIATAHQKNDNAETVLQRLARGTGFRGLGGICPMRVFAGKVPFVRPLLFVTRDEILRFLHERNVPWRRDHTNADCTYRRNYIRHRLLPALQRDCAGSVVEQLSELAQRARLVQSLIDRRVDHLWPEVAESTDGRIVLHLKIFLAQPHALQIELVRRGLTAIGCGERDLTQRHYERILSLAQQNVTGGQTDLSGGFLVRREYGNLIFAVSQTNEIMVGQAPPCIFSGTQTGESVQLEIPGRTRFGGYLIEATVYTINPRFEIRDSKSRASSPVERFDLEKVKLPLQVRSRRAGDRFVPLGLSEERKLGKFLTAQHVPPEVRKKVLVVIDSEKIIWVWPIRISEQAKISTGTPRILQLRITDIEG